VPAVLKFVLWGKEVKGIGGEDMMRKRKTQQCIGMGRMDTKKGANVVEKGPGF